MLVGLSASVQGVHLQKEAVVVGGPLILIMHVLESNIDYIEIFCN